MPCWGPLVWRCAGAAADALGAAADAGMPIRRLGGAEGVVRREHLGLGLVLAVQRCVRCAVMALREDRERLGSGTPRYSSANVQFERGEFALSILSVSLSTAV